VNLAKIKLAAKTKSKTHATTVTFQGYLKLAKNNELVSKDLLDDVKVTFTNADGLSYNSKVNLNGSYETTLPTGIYTRTVTSSHFVNNSAKICIHTSTSNFQAKHNIFLTIAPPVLNVLPAVKLITVRGYIKNATNNKLFTAEMLNQGNASFTYTNKKTNVVYKATFLPGGIYQVSLQAGDYIRDVLFDKFAEMTQEVHHYASSNETDMKNVVYLSPEINGYRIVLTWGAKPKDLDTHLVMPDGSEVNFDNKISADKHVTLDVDATNGYGPETISLVDITPGVYYYYVNKFSSEETLTNSKAKVTVFKGSKLVKEIKVPANGDGALDYWNVLKIDATKDKLIVVNELRDSA
jgi:hypothetical protein